jgi:cardiolipin synthase
LPFVFAVVSRLDLWGSVPNRSFRLNFEVTAVVADPRFARQVAAMFERDLARSRLMVPEDLAQRPLWRRAFSRAANLLSPVV